MSNHHASLSQHVEKRSVNHHFLSPSPMITDLDKSNVRYVREVEGVSYAFNVYYQSFLESLIPF